jgi:hypothetical protein
MKDLIIGASTGYNWDTLKYWVNSINQSGFDGDKVLVLMNCDIESVKKVIEAGFKVIGFGQNEKGDLVYEHGRVPVHVERFIHIYDHLSRNDYRFVITTDVKDVVFQQNPIPHLQKLLDESDKDYVFASESMKYKDEPWGDQNLLETYGQYIYDKFKHNTIYNVGVLAGRGHAIRDLTINIFTAAINRPIPICDQSTFNFMISQEPYRSTSLYMNSEDGWAAQLGTTADPSKIEQFRPFLLEAEPEMVDGKVTTSTGKVFTIVHQYDRIPEWRKIIEAKYG